MANIKFSNVHKSFGSNKIIKILDKKTKMLLSNVKLNRDSMLSVLKVAKNKLPIYKEHN